MQCKLYIKDASCLIQPYIMCYNQYASLHKHEELHLEHKIV